MKTVLLADICNIVGGGTPSKANRAFYGGTIPWATVRDMNTDLLEDTQFHITQEAVEKSSTNVIPKGNVIIASRVGLGKVCILKQDTAINQDLRAIIPKDKDSLDARYIFWWVKSIASKIIDAGTGATVHGVKLPFIKGLSFALPSIEEQKRVVKKLDETFGAIDKVKEDTIQKLNNLEELKQSILQQALKGKL